MVYQGGLKIRLSFFTRQILLPPPRDIIFGGALELVCVIAVL